MVYSIYSLTRVAVFIMRSFIHFDYQNILMRFKESLCIQRLVIKEANVSCWNEEEPVFSSLERN